MTEPNNGRAWKGRSVKSPARTSSGSKTDASKSKSDSSKSKFGTSKVKKTARATTIAGEGASDNVKAFLKVFFPLADITPESEAARDEEWPKADMHGNDALSLTMMERWAERRLTTALGQKEGATLYKAYFSAIIRAFSATREVPDAPAADHIDKAHFRLLVANFCFYALAIDAFGAIDTGASKGKQNNSSQANDQRFTKGEFVAGCRKIAKHGFIALSDESATDEYLGEIFTKMDHNSGGTVVLTEFCNYVKDAEISADTLLGSLVNGSSVRLTTIAGGTNTPARRKLKIAEAAAAEQEAVSASPKQPRRKFVAAKFGDGNEGEVVETATPDQEPDLESSMSEAANAEPDRAIDQADLSKNEVDEANAESKGELDLEANAVHEQVDATNAEKEEEIDLEANQVDEPAAENKEAVDEAAENKEAVEEVASATIAAVDLEANQADEQADSAKTEPEVVDLEANQVEEQADAPNEEIKEVEPEASQVEEQADAPVEESKEDVDLEANVVEEQADAEKLEPDEEVVPGETEPAETDEAKETVETASETAAVAEEPDEQVESAERSPPEEKEEVVEASPPDEKEEVVEASPPDEKEEVVEASPPDEKEEVAEASPPDEKEEVVEASPPDEKEEVVEASPPDEKEEVVAATPPDEKEDVVAATPPDEKEDVPPDEEEPKVDESEEQAPADEKEPTRDEPPGEAAAPLVQRDRRKCCYIAGCFWIIACVVVIVVAWSMIK